MLNWNFTCSPHASAMRILSVFVLSLTLVGDSYADTPKPKPKPTPTPTPVDTVRHRGGDTLPGVDISLDKKPGGIAHLHGERCSGNVIANGEFSAGLNITGNGSMPPSSVDNWSAAARDPQLGRSSPTPGVCGGAGFVAMWGNQLVGEAIHQKLKQPLEVGSTFRFSACVRYANPSAAGPVRLKVRVSNGPLPNYAAPGVLIGISSDISSGEWSEISLPDWTVTAAHLSTITISPENRHAVNDGSSVSWLHIDNICLERVSPSR